jgi:hypothetical protein
MSINFHSICLKPLNYLSLSLYYDCLLSLLPGMYSTAPVHLPEAGISWSLIDIRLASYLPVNFTCPDAVSSINSWLFIDLILAYGLYLPHMLEAASVCWLTVVWFQVCLSSYLRVNSTCPICRKPLNQLIVDWFQACLSSYLRISVVEPEPEP